MAVNEFEESSFYFNIYLYRQLSAASNSQSFKRNSSILFKLFGPQTVAPKSKQHLINTVFKRAFSYAFCLIREIAPWHYQSYSWYNNTHTHRHLYLAVCISVMCRDNNNGVHPQWVACRLHVSLMFISNSKRMFAAVRGCTRPSPFALALAPSGLQLPSVCFAKGWKLSRQFVCSFLVNTRIALAGKSFALASLGNRDNAHTHRHPHPRTLTRTFVFMNAQFSRDSRATVRQCAVSGKVIHFAELTCVQMKCFARWFIEIRLPTASLLYLLLINAIK